MNILKRLSVILCFLGTLGLVQGQQVREISQFEELKPLLENAQNDTLLVFNFWATWCRPCVREMPYFIHLDSAYKDKKVKVILISLDMPELIDTKVKAFVEKRGISQEVIVLTDPRQNDWIPQVSEAWTGAIPATLVVEAQSGVRAFKEQSFTYEELSRWIEKLLAERDS